MKKVKKFILTMTDGSVVHLTADDLDTKDDKVTFYLKGNTEFVTPHRNLVHIQTAELH